MGAFAHTAAVKFCKRNFFEGKKLIRGAAFASSEFGSRSVFSMSNSQTVSPSQNISSPQAIPSQTISLHIPFLRRFSRALTGNQPGGDAYVRATLEAIVADPAGLAAAGDGRTALYRIFLKIW